jgi:sugar lactone lactonase YvrE
VDPDDGDVQVLADKIMSPTGLAVDDEGDVFVASLFGNGILRIDGHSGRQSTLLSAASVADVDLHGSMLYATVNTLPPDGAPATPLNGQIVSVDLKHGSHNRGSDD